MPSRPRPRVVAADHESHCGAKRANQLDETERCLPLKGHHREPDEVGLPLTDEPIDGLSDVALGENQIGDGHPVVAVDIAGQRAERAVRHADADRRHVLERVRHRDEEDVHSSSYPRSSARSASTARAR